MGPKPILCRSQTDIGPGAFCVRCGRVPQGKDNEINLVWIPLCSKCCKELNWMNRVEKDLHTPAPLMQIGKTYTSFVDLIGEKVHYLPLSSSIPEHLNYVSNIVFQSLTNADVRARYGQVLGIPQRYWYTSLQQFTYIPGQDDYFVLPPEYQRAIIDISRGWVNVMTSGSSGTGKSHLAAAWLYAMITAVVCYRWSAQWINMSDFITQVRQTYDKDSETHGQGDSMIQKIIETDVLVIDELACDHLSQHGLQVVLQIIEGRLNRTCSTFVTSNNTAADFYKREQRIGSRLNSFIQVSAKGSDRRLDPSIRSAPLPALPAEPKPQTGEDDDFEYSLVDARRDYQELLQLEQSTGERADLQRWALARLCECEHVDVNQIIPQGETLY